MSPIQGITAFLGEQRTGLHCDSKGGGHGAPAKSSQASVNHVEGFGIPLAHQISSNKPLQRGCYQVLRDTQLLQFVADNLLKNRLELAF